MKRAKSFPNLVVTGSLAVDTIGNFDQRFRDLAQPENTHFLSISVFVPEIKRSLGGTAGNIAYTYGLLGGKPHLLASIGKDHASDLKRLEQVGLSTKSVHFSELPTAMFTVLTDQEDSQVGFFYPGAMFDSSELSLHKTPADSWVIISPHDPKQMMKQVTECRELGLPLMFDLGQQVLNSPVELIRAGIEAAEIVIFNDFEAEEMAKRVGQSLSSIKKMVPIFITTLGAEGSVIEGKNVEKLIKVPPAKPKKVVDPTGAGDAYRAGFMRGLIAGEPLETCGRIGSLCATYVVEQKGTQAHEFTLKQFRLRYLQEFGQSLNLPD